MSSKGFCSFSSGDYAVHLDLIGRVNGLESAESYFNNLREEYKIEKSYGALLICYVRGGLVDKSLSHMQKMKELGFASSALVYNDIMCLYTHSGQHEKIHDVLTEMKKSGVFPDNFSYRICINSYGVRSDIKNMEKVLEEMESQPQITMDWTTYSMVTNFFIRAGDHEKSLFYMKKCEGLVDKDALGYSHLISLYASLGRKGEMMRLWNLSKGKCKRQINRDYITMLGSLVKLGELEETEKFLKEWESSGNCYDFRVPNVLLIGYCQNGLVEKAETRLQEIVKKGKTPTPNSWAIIASGYLDSQNMQKAFECMKEALAVQVENKGWRPKPRTVSSLLTWLGDNGDFEEAMAFIKSLMTVIPVNREIYLALIKIYIRSGKDVDLLLQSMRSDNIDVDEEAENILSSREK